MKSYWQACRDFDRAQKQFENALFWGRPETIARRKARRDHELNYMLSMAPK